MNVRQSLWGPAIADARLQVKVASPHAVGGYVLTNATDRTGAVVLTLIERLRAHFAKAGSLREGRDRFAGRLGSPNHPSRIDRNAPRVASITPNR
jgi:hypothetical protein